MIYFNSLNTTKTKNLHKCLWSLRWWVSFYQRGSSFEAKRFPGHFHWKTTDNKFQLHVYLNESKKLPGFQRLPHRFLYISCSQFVDKLRSIDVLQRHYSHLLFHLFLNAATGLCERVTVPIDFFRCILKTPLNGLQLFLQREISTKPKCNSNHENCNWKSFQSYSSSILPGLWSLCLEKSRNVVINATLHHRVQVNPLDIVLFYSRRPSIFCTFPTLPSAAQACLSTMDTHFLVLWEFYVSAPKAAETVGRRQASEIKENTEK